MKEAFEHSVNDLADRPASNKVPNSTDDKNHESESSALPKVYHSTICFVPPESADVVWDKLSTIRTELRDPGLFRWPPHVNLLYPFVEWRHPSRKKNSTTTRAENSSTTLSIPLEKKISPMDNVLEQLQSACRQCEPFRVELKQLGTFGGKKRGALWLYPRSYRHDDGISKDNNCEENNRDKSEDETQISDKENNQDDTSDPLHQLQSLLEQAFPHCTEQRTAGGRNQFSPHLTLSHFPTLNEAQTAQAKLEKSTWENVVLDFEVDRIYVLYRQGDAGQFCRRAEILLGTPLSQHEDSFSNIILHDPPKPFCYMPQTEADWVYRERMALKTRRRSNRRGRTPRRGRSLPKIQESDGT